MRKICIVGCGGSGKSALAVKLNSRLDIPVYHLDSLFWQPNWVEMNKVKWEKLQVELCSRPEWIIDGNYGRTLDIRFEASDVIIFLDLPVYLCLWRVLTRQFKYRGIARPDMGRECKERFSFSFIWWVVGFAKTRKPRIIKKLSDLSGKQIIILKSKEDVDKFVCNIKQ